LRIGGTAGQQKGSAPARAESTGPGSTPPEALLPAVELAGESEAAVAARDLKAAVALKVPRIPDSEAAEPPPRGEPEAAPPTRAASDAGLESERLKEEQTAAPDGAALGPLIPPVLLRAAWRSYPDVARKRKSQGMVEVRILVDVNGNVADVEVLRSSGEETLNQTALESARTMVFRPATRGGQPVPVWFNYRFDFSLPQPGSS
jgi:protein TonB